MAVKGFSEFTALSKDYVLPSVIFAVQSIYTKPRTYSLLRSSKKKYNYEMRDS